MRELSLKNQKPVTKNRFKKTRRKIDLRGFFKKAARIAVTVLVISLIGLTGQELYGFVGKTTFLRLDRIDVSGNKKLTREEILAAASVQLGDDLLALNITSMGAQLSKNPWVAGVKVRRDLPHSLSIEVSEHQPVAIVSMGYLYYLDNRGEIFKPLQEGDSLDFPVITGLSEEDLQRDPAGARKTIDGIMTLLGEIGTGKGAITIADISELHYDKGFGYTLFTVEHGLPLRLGMSGFSEKLDRLSRIYPELQANMRQLEYIDLDYSDKIVVKKV